MSTRTPKWLAAEIEELGKRVLRNEVDRDEAVATLNDHIFEKDEKFARTLTVGWVSGQLQKQINARKRELEVRVDQAVAGQYQGGFDEICSDYWSRETYGPHTPLSELEKYDEQMSTMTAGFLRRDEERHQRLIELLRAVGGNRDATWEEAERARLGLTGDTAAEG